MSFVGKQIREDLLKKIYYWGYFGMRTNKRGNKQKEGTWFQTICFWE